MRFCTHPFWLAMPAFAFLPLIPAQHASAQTLVYDNTTSATGGVVFNGSTNHGGNTLTNMNADDLTLAAGFGGQAITHFLFEADNFGTAATTARPSIFFWAANGTNGDAGTYLAGISLPNTTFPVQQATPLSADITGLIIPANGKIWAGIVYDDNFGATGATAAQLNSLGALTYNPPSVGSSGFGAAFGSLGSYAGVNNPAVTDYNFGGTVPINFGWQLKVAATPEPGGLALWAGMALCGHIAMRRIRRR